ncbi:MAG: response regulator [Gammaproteobacteria bacterium]|nr:response regulator [Gammaproteobacteria bacterium]
MHQILMVEDNPADIELMQQTVRELGRPINLHICNDGVTAVDFLNRRGQYNTVPVPDLVFLDLNLPRRGGIEVLLMLMQRPETRMIPVIVFSMSNRKDDITQAYSLGARCYIHKSVNYSHFLTTMEQLFRFWFDYAVIPGGSAAG